MNYKLVIFGAKSTTKKIIESIHKEVMNIDLVVTVKETEKDTISGYSNLSDLCQQLGIPIYYVDNYRLIDQNDIDFFNKHTFELGISTGWQRIIPSHVLNRFTKGIFGFHGSAGHLPYGRGRSPLNWSIIQGEKRFINHCFQYDADADTGNIHSTRVFEINEFDTIETLQYKTMMVMKDQVTSLISNYKNDSICLYKQSDTPLSWFKKRTPEDGKIHLTESTTEIYNLIRGVTKPFPGTFLLDGNGEKMIIWKAYPFDRFIDNREYKVGEVVETFDTDFILNLIDGFLIVRNYQYEQSVKKKSIFY